VRQNTTPRDEQQSSPQDGSDFFISLQLASTNIDQDLPVRLRRSNDFKVKMLKRLPNQGEAVEKAYLIVTVHWFTPLNEVLMRSSSAIYPYRITCISFAGIIAGVRISSRK